MIETLKGRLVELMKTGWWLPHHDCGACGATVHYYMVRDQLFFDSNCDCGSGRSAPQPRNLDELDHMVQQPTWAARLLEMVERIEAP